LYVKKDENSIDEPRLLDKKKTLLSLLSINFSIRGKKLLIKKYIKYTHRMTDTNVN
jgi:hypothetical protein